MASKILKRSVVIRGHKTSVSLEEEFFSALHHIAKNKRIALRTLIEQIDHDQRSTNLSSSIRLYVLKYYRAEDEKAAR